MVLAWAGMFVVYVSAMGLAHGPLWDNELIGVSSTDADGLCFVGNSQPGREWCYSFEEAPAIADLTTGDCARLDGPSMSFTIEESEKVPCPNDASRLTPEVPTLPAIEVAELESRGLVFEFVETESDFGRWCGGALVQEVGVIVSEATYDVDDIWWECWGRPPEMNASDEPEVEVFEDLDALDEGALIVGWAPPEIAEVVIRDGAEVLRFDLTATGGRFGTRMLASEGEWSLSVSSRSGESWSCPWVVDGAVQCAN